MSDAHKAATEYYDARRALEERCAHVERMSAECIAIEDEIRKMLKRVAELYAIHEAALEAELATRKDQDGSHYARTCARARALVGA